MKLSLILAAGALAVGTVAAVPADAQRWHDGGGHHGGGHGYGHGGYHGGGGYRGGGYGYRGGGHYRGDYSYRRGFHGGYRGRLVCRYRHGLRRCFRV